MSRAARRCGADAKFQARAAEQARARIKASAAQLARLRSQQARSGHGPQQGRHAR